MAIAKAPSGGLETYDPAQYNILTPMLLTDETSPMHQVRTQSVRINPKDGAGDVFAMQGGKLYLAASARRKLAALAGIMENWRESGLIEDTPEKVKYRAIGAIQDAVGQWRPVTATKTIELEQLRKIKGEGEVKAIWAYRYERAETGAWSRLATAALGLKSAYTAEELAKPFAVSRVILAIDYNDPETRRMITARALDAQANVFGQPTTPRGYLTAGGTPATVGEVIDLDKAATDTGLPEDEFPEALPSAMAATAAPVDPADPIGDALPFDAPTPRPPPRAKRGTDGSGEWLGCQTPGCTKRLRVLAGQSADDVEDQFRATYGSVCCHAHRPAPGQGRML